MRHERLLLILILLLGLCVRLPVASTDFHASSDLTTFRDWQQAAESLGLERIYENGKVNYPPIGLYWLTAAAWLSHQIAPQSEAWRNALIKLLPIMADVLTAGLIALALRKRSVLASLLGASAYVFNPAIWYVSAYWGQVDSLYAVFLVAAVQALERRATRWVWVWYALALATKLQSVALAPLVVVLTATRAGKRGLFQGFVALVVVAAVVWLPWLLSGYILDFLRTLAEWPNQPVRVDVSAYNLWYLLRLGRVHNVSAELHPLGLPFSYQTIGFMLFSGYAVLVMVLTLGRQPIALAAASLSLGLFMLPTQIHERFMFPVIAFLMLATVREPRLWIAYGVASATFFFNLITIAPFTDVLGTNLVAADVGSTTTWVLKVLSLLTAAINVAMLMWLTARLAVRHDSPLGRPRWLRFIIDMRRGWSNRHATGIGLLLIGLIALLRGPSLVSTGYLNVGNVASVKHALAHDANWSQAQTAFATAERWNARDGRIAAAQGRLAALSDQPASAVASFAQAIDRAYDSDLIHFQLGLALDQSGEHDRAIAEWRRARAGNYFRQQGLALRHQKDWSGAESALREAVMIAPDDAEAWHTLGVFYWEWNHLPAAEECLRHALAQEARAYERLLLQGEIALLAGRFADAEQFLAEAIQLQPPRSVAYVRLAELRSQADGRQAAIAVLRNAMALTAPSLDLALPLARWLRDEQQFAEADALYAQAQRYDSHSDEPPLYRGQNAWAWGHDADALTYLKQAVTLGARNAEAHFWLATVEAQHGNWAPACAQFRLAASLATDDPTYQPPENARVECQGRP